MFWTRFISTIVLAPLVIWGILAISLPTFEIVTAIVMMLVAWEWAGLIPIRSNYNKIIYLLLMLGFFGFIQFIQEPLYILSVGVLWWLVAIFLLVRYEKYESKKNRRLLHTLYGLLAIAPCWVALNTLRAEAHGPQMILLFLLMLWSTDIGAYLVGSRIGRTRIAPKLSPKKSFEGAAGGLVLMLLVAIGGIVWLHIPVAQWVSYFLTAVALFVFSIIGDLFESLLKRKQGVKDSGKLIPGHGGIFDRLDSMLAAAPIYTFAILIGQLAR
jgi:phosphatidate cytidylyltransferase